MNAAEREKRRQRSLELWSDPAYRERVNAARNAARAKPEVIMRQKKGAEEWSKRPAVRTQISATMKALWQNPDYVLRVKPKLDAARLDAGVNARRMATRAITDTTPETMEKRSKAATQTWRKRKLAAARLRRQQERPMRPENCTLNVPVPKWAIDAGLEQDFRDMARERGEQEAAAFCRRLKRDAESKAHD